MLAMCPSGKLGIQGTKRTNILTEEKDVEIGDYSPVK